MFREGANRIDLPGVEVVLRVRPNHLGADGDGRSAPVSVIADGDRESVALQLGPRPEERRAQYAPLRRAVMFRQQVAPWILTLTRSFFGGKTTSPMDQKVASLFFKQEALNPHVHRRRLLPTASLLG